MFHRKRVAEISPVTSSTANVVNDDPHTLPQNYTAWRKVVSSSEVYVLEERGPVRLQSAQQRVRDVIPFTFSEKVFQEQREDSLSKFLMRLFLLLEPSKNRNGLAVVPLVERLSIYGFSLEYAQAEQKGVALHNDALLCIHLLLAFWHPWRRWDELPNGIENKHVTLGVLKFTGPFNREAMFIRLNDRYLYNPDKPLPGITGSSEASRAHAMFEMFGNDSALAAVAAIHTLQVERFGHHFQPPTLIISVTGGARSFDLTPNLASLVETGLKKATKSSNAWVITGGTNCGVMKLTGEILTNHARTVGKYTSPLIGIATWGIIASRYEKLVVPSCNISYEATQSNHLDANHSHLLLVDDGTDNVFGREIAFRGRFEEYAAKGYSCPAITIVVQGGPGTLDTALASIKANHPILVIDGSGQVADLLAYAYNFLHSTKQRHAQHSLVSLKEKTLRQFPHLAQSQTKPKNSQDDGKEDEDEDEVRRFMDKLLHCVQIPALVVVYSEKDGIPFENAILETVFKNQERQQNRAAVAVRTEAEPPRQPRAQKAPSSGHATPSLSVHLRSTQRVAWTEQYEDEDGVDTAVASLPSTQPSERAPREHKQTTTTAEPNMPSNGSSAQIFANMLKQTIFFDRLDRGREQLRNCQPDERKEGLSQGLMVALRHNKPEFVKLFLEHDPELSNLKSASSGNFYDAVKELYFQAAQSSDSYLAKLVKAAGFDPSVVESYAAEKMEQMLLEHTGLSWAHSQPGNVKDLSQEQAALHLFIWAVSVNNFRIAREMWKRCADTIPCALVAAKILHRLKNHHVLRGPHLADERQKMQKIRRKFEALATETLESCYETDSQLARQLLLNPVAVVEDTSTQKPLNILQLSSKCELQSFIAHRATQAVITAEWDQNIHDLFNHWIGVLFAVLFPILILPFKAINYVRRTSDNSNPPKPNYFVRLWHTIYDLYTPPIVKFSLDAASHVILCALFSFVVVVEYNSGIADATNISLSELLIILWVVAVFVDEIRQWVEAKWEYTSSLWNLFDVIILLLFCGGMGVRAFDGARLQIVAKTVMSIVAVLLIVRGIRFYSIFEFLGPKLVMIERMAADVAAFALLLGIFLLAFGVASQSMLHPSRELDRHTLQNVLVRPYFMVYGELFVEEYSAEAGCNSATFFTSCLWRHVPVVPVLMAGYLLIANVLLVNLVIAMFNDTYAAVKVEATELWCTQYLQLLTEYQHKPVFPAPLSLLLLPYTLWCGSQSECCHDSDGDDGDGSKHGRLVPDTRNKMEAFQQNGMRLFWQEKIASSSVDKLDDLDKILDKVRLDLYGLMDQQASLGTLFELYDANTQFTKLADDNSNDHTQLASVYEDSGDQEPAAISGSPLRVQSMVPVAIAASAGPRMKRGATRALAWSARFSRNLAGGTEKDRQYLSYWPDSNGQDTMPHGKPIVRQKLKAKELLVPNLANYNPPEYTVPFSQDLPGVDPLVPTKHMFDDRVRYSKAQHTHRLPESLHERKYHVDEKGYPINPFGRTGLRGRGALYRWGPNHTVDLLITRWRRDDQSNILRRNGKPVAEFIAIKRPEGDWSLPGTFVRDGETELDTAWRLWFTKVLAWEKEPSLNFADQHVEFKDPKVQQEHLAKVQQVRFAKRILKQAFEMDGKPAIKQVSWQMYSWDDRNTDNAWVETTCFHIHDNHHEMTSKIKLVTGENDWAARWTMVTPYWKLWASHAHCLANAAKALDCAFTSIDGDDLSH
eukprot:m.306405 g.306405  ORF g.306405 m.306405 type:complete len:1729 (-) comp15922_c0_seq1:74-5260(-)